MARFLAIFFYLSILILKPAFADDLDEFTKQLEQDLKELKSTSSVAEAATTEDEMPAENTAAPEPSLVTQNEETTSTELAQPAEATELAESEPSSSARPNIIMDIAIEGNQIVSTNTIISKIQSRKGSPLSQDAINEDLKRLYATGFFEDIKMEVVERPDGYTLQIAVVEKPIIKKIVIEGFTAFKEEKLRKEFKVIEGQILDRKAVKEGSEAIRKLYHNKGFRFMDVVSDVDINFVTKEATVYVRIKEDAKYKIEGIRFEGVKAFPEKKLFKMMKTKAKAPILFRSGVFKQENFDQDLERLRLFYQQEGYLDVKLAPEFQYDKTGQKMFIKILVEEGPHYVTGDIKIEGNRLFPQSEIWQELDMLPGETFSQYYLSKDVEKIRQYYYQRGYMDARIVPDTKLDRDTNKVNVIYSIEEGDLYFVEKVVVRGNTKTKDIVIRRELRIRPGERFDGTKIEKSKQRLENLGFFEEITYDTEPSRDAANKKDLIFRVKEKRTGELSFGGGVSSVDSFVGFVELSQRNFDLFNWPRFTGDGQLLSLKGRFGTINQHYALSFEEPYLFNKPISLGTDIFSTHRDDKNVDFDEQRRGVAVNLSRGFKDVYRVGTGYTLERVRLDDISDDAPETVRKFAGASWLSRYRIFSSIDTRDNIFNPTKGTQITLNGDLVGSFLGGDEDFYVLQTSATQYWNFFKKHILEARLRLGTSQDFGDSDEVPIYDRFYAGGLGTVRGFNYRRVGPIEAGNAVGGQTLVVANLEYTFPILRMDAFRGAVFVDAGHVNPDAYDINFGDISISTGPGVKIKTPLGPVAFYYGFPLANKDTENRNGRFEFSLSRGF